MKFTLSEKISGRILLWFFAEIFVFKVDILFKKQLLKIKKKICKATLRPNTSKTKTYFDLPDFKFKFKKIKKIEK